MTSHLLRRADVHGPSLAASVLVRVGRNAWQAARSAPAFVHLGLAAGAAAAAIGLARSGALLSGPSLPARALWEVAGAAAAGILAAAAYAGGGWRPGAARSGASATMLRRASRAAITRYVAAQVVCIAALLLLAGCAVAVFRNTGPGVFVAAMAAGGAAVLTLALFLLDRSRFAVLADLAGAAAVAHGWRAAAIAHVHRERVAAAIAWDAAMARQSRQPSLMSRIVAAGDDDAANDGSAQRRGRVRLPDMRFSPHRAAAEARLRVRGLLPILALAVPYAMAAAIAAALLTRPPPAGRLPAPTAAPAGDQQAPDGGQERADGPQAAGAGRPQAAAGGQQAAGTGGPQAAGGGGQQGADSGGRAAGTGDRQDAGSDSQRNMTAAGQPQPPGGLQAGEGRQPPARTGQPAAGGGPHESGGQAAAGGQPSSSGNAPEPGEGHSREAGRGPKTKPFLGGQAPAGGPDVGTGEIVVTGTGADADGNTAEPRFDSAPLRAIRQAPAPLIDWPSPSAAPPGGTSAPRPYRPRQALPAWTAPLLPGGASATRAP